MDAPQDIAKYQPDRPYIGIVWLVWVAHAGCVGPSEKSGEGVGGEGPGGGGAEGDDGAGDTHASPSGNDSGGADSGSRDTGPEDTGTIVTLAAEDAVRLTWHEVLVNAEGSAQIASDGGTIDGVISYVEVYDGAVRCDLTLLLSGMANSGTCAGCDYTFDVETTVDAERSVGDCDLLPWLAYASVGEYVNPRLAIASEYVSSDPYGGWATYDDVLLAGFSFEDTEWGYQPGPYYQMTVYDGNWRDEGSISLADGLLAWAADDDTEYGLLNEYAYCGTAVYSDATEPYGGTSVSEYVDCAAHYMDGWTFESTAGETVSVTVATDDPTYNLMPRFFVNGPDGCGIVKGLENYRCISEDVGLVCPSARFEAELTGTYTVWVYSTGLYCDRSTDVPYRLIVDG